MPVSAALRRLSEDPDFWALLLADDGATPPEGPRELRLAFPVAGLALADVYDYESHEIRAADGSTRPLPEPSGDLLIFHLDEPGTRFAARPSGTEPKIKFYLFARTGTERATGPADLGPIKEQTTARLDRMARDIEKYIQDALVESSS